MRGRRPRAGAGDAGRMIAFGDAEVMVAGGTEAAIGPIALALFARMKARSLRPSTCPFRTVDMSVSYGRTDWYGGR